MSHDTKAVWKTPLELFIDALRTQDLPLLTEKGTASVRQQVAIGLPFLPAVVITGSWYDWTGGAVAAATSAIVAAEEPSDDTDDTHTIELDAHYVMGLLVGLALAHALTGTRGPQ